MSICNCSYYQNKCFLFCSILDIQCGVPQNLILGPLLMIYINDLAKASDVLDPINVCRWY